MVAMEKRWLLLIMIFAFFKGLAQPGANIDSLKRALAAADDVNTRFLCTSSLFSAYVYTLPDSAMVYARQSMLLARQLNSDSAVAVANLLFKEYSFITGSYPQALKYALEGMRLAEKSGGPLLMIYASVELGEVYREQGDYKRALAVLRQGKAVLDSRFPFDKINPNSELGLRYQLLYGNLGMVYEKDGQLDSALKAMSVAERMVMRRRGSMDWAPVYWVYGNVYNKRGNYSKALAFYRAGIVVAERRNVRRDFIDNCYGLASVHQKMHQWDSSIYYANKVLEANKTARYPIGQLNALGLLASVYKEKRNADSTAKYFELAIAAKDSLFNQEKLVQMQNLTFDEQVRRQELEEAERGRLYRARLYALMGGLAVVGVIAFLLYRNNQHKQKAKAQIERAYNQLKAAQAQLIQQEKMASLGELTAGIAHEIQNPLNFVNNFSAVNKELLSEMNEEIEKGNFAEVKAIAADLQANEEKITYHGSRADSIVKGMLQHARASTGKKEPTDVNKLADEYLRLSYQGMRSKDKAFNAALQINFDETIGPVSIVPQDIGRVLLNLFNNAFYAVNEKKKTLNGTFEPCVQLTTRKEGDKVLIAVRDNGCGISQKVVGKIFQPFFTTKPTGEGTGLGLSLSYDIITKGHGGEIKVNTKEGEGSEFIIRIAV